MSERPEPQPVHATLRATRREFLRAATGFGVAGMAASVGSCGDVGSDDPATSRSGAAGDGGGPIPLTRPTLRPWAQAMVWLDVATRFPVAYVSMESRQVFVDWRFRDRAVGLLEAHISVSTALWRIPLPGDPRGIPITPGDPLREFEERSMDEWDAQRTPSMDDIRICRGGLVSRRVSFKCVPLGGPSRPAASAAAEPSTWCTAGPWPMDTVDAGVATADSAGDVSAAEGTSAGDIEGTSAGDVEEMRAAEVQTTREDFSVVGTGLRHDERRCSDAGEVIQLVAWAVRSG